MHALDSSAPSEASTPRSAVRGALAMTLLGAMVAVPVYLDSGFVCRLPRTTRAGTDAQALRSSVELYRLHVPGTCPDASVLMREHYASWLASDKYDPWGTPYAIRCPGDQDVEVRSAGPDGAFDTDDDVATH